MFCRCRLGRTRIFLAVDKPKHAFKKWPEPFVLVVVLVLVLVLDGVFEHEHEDDDEDGSDPSDAYSGFSSRAMRSRTAWATFLPS